MGDTPAESLPEERRNAALRREDWRFLLHREDAPSPVDPRRTGFPSRRALSAARATLPPGGELLCGWRRPRWRGAQRARRNLERAGLTDVRLLWPGPLPHRPPQFWLPPDSPAAAAHLLASRPPRSAAQRALRPLWRLAARLGLLAPVFALARAPGGEGTGEDGLARFLPAGAPCLLLTGGRRSINKVVALPFAPGEREPAAVVKFSRLPEVDAALGREAAALEAIAASRPSLAGVPRLLARGRRGGGLGLAESAIFGRPLIEALGPDSLESLAGRVTAWLVELGGGDTAATGWRERLVAAPLADLERDFGAAAPQTIAAARSLLAELGELPRAPEHRDCSPWNVVLTESGEPALLDWESAEPRGLPGLDLVYFLANAAFVLDGALESGRTRESYARLLDPGHPHGRVFARCTGEYGEALGLSAADFARLRALCWVVHCRSDRRHLEMAAAGSPTVAQLRESPFLGLLEEELARR